MTDFLPLDDTLDRIAADCHDADNRNLLDRWRPVADWMEARLAAGIDPHAKVQIGRIGPRAILRDRAGRFLSGVNFASEDPLGLGAHPALMAAAQTAAARHGMHAAGSPDAAGLTSAARALEERIAAFLGTADATAFSTGWTAGFEAIRVLVDAGDHVLIDAHCPPGLMEAAARATRKVFPIPHGSVAHAEARLEAIRSQEPDAGILVVTCGLFADTSDSPDLGALRRLCRRYEATLLVDVSHDLGVMGPGGRGAIGAQGLLGQVDVITGSLGRGFASAGGFVAGDHPALKAALRLGSGAQALSSAVSPMQAAAALAAIDLVDGEEGAARRARLEDNVRRLRAGLLAEGFDVRGEASAIVPVHLGAPAEARRMTAEMLGSGAIVNLDEPPIVPRGACRWRLQVMAGHSAADIDLFVALAGRARSGPRAMARPH